MQEKVAPGGGIYADLEKQMAEKDTQITALQNQLGSGESSTRKTDDQE